MSGKIDTQTVIDKLEKQLKATDNEQLKRHIRMKLASLKNNEIVRK